MSIKINRLEEGHNSYPLVCWRPAETVSLKQVVPGMWAWEIVYHLLLSVELEFILVTFVHQYMT
jgi:hypothetical protein